MDAAWCEPCGCKTFEKDHPDVHELFEAQELQASQSFDAKVGVIASFAVGVPVFALSLSFASWIAATIIAAGAVLGVTHLAKKFRTRRRSG